jgi:hypothetical protein
MFITRIDRITLIHSVNTQRNLFEVMLVTRRINHVQNVWLLISNIYNITVFLLNKHYKYFFAVEYLHQHVVYITLENTHMFVLNELVLNCPWPCISLFHTLIFIQVYTTTCVLLNKHEIRHSSSFWHYTLYVYHHRIPIQDHTLGLGGDSW